MTSRDVRQLYQDRYAQEPLVKVIGESPQGKLRGSPYIFFRNVFLRTQYSATHRWSARCRAGRLCRALLWPQGRRRELPYHTLYVRGIKKLKQQNNSAQRSTTSSKVLPVNACVSFSLLFPLLREGSTVSLTTMKENTNLALGFAEYEGIPTM
jgi:hypothetical protein